MTTDVYIHGERYFLIVSSELMENDIPAVIKAMYDYPLDESFLLKDICNINGELTDGRFAISIQIAPYQNYVNGSTSVSDYITQDDFEKAKIFYGVAEMLTLAEFKELEFKE